MSRKKREHTNRSVPKNKEEQAEIENKSEKIEQSEQTKQQTMETSNDKNQSEEHKEEIEEEIEEVIETSAVIDSIMEDKRKIFSIIGAFLVFAGSYLSFWGVYSNEYGRLSQGNLFGGYLAGGILGKLCVLSAVVAVVFLCINMFRFAMYGVYVCSAALIVQIAVILIFGWNVLGSTVSVILYPGFGFFVCIAGVVLMNIYIRKIFKVIRKKEM